MKKQQIIFRIFSRGVLASTLICLCLLHINQSAVAQTYDDGKKSKLKVKSSSIESGLKKGDNELTIAAKYEDLAQELVKNNELVKAEEYQNKAVELYKKNNSKKITLHITSNNFIRQNAFNNHIYKNIIF